MHFHNFYELDIITDGSGVSNLNGKTIKFQKNTAFFLSPKDFHDIIPDTDLTYNKSTDFQRHHESLFSKLCVDERLLLFF